MIISHTSDWAPGKVSNDYRDNYDKIFNKEKPGPVDVPIIDVGDKVSAESAPGVD